MHKSISTFQHPWLASFVLCLSSQLALTSQISHLLCLTQNIQSDQQISSKESTCKILCHKTVNVDDQEKLCQSITKDDKEKFLQGRQNKVSRTKWGTLICFGGPVLSALAGTLADVVDGRKDRLWGPRNGNK